MGTIWPERDVLSWAMSFRRLPDHVRPPPYIFPMTGRTVDPLTLGHALRERGLEGAHRGEREEGPLFTPGERRKQSSMVTSEAAT